MTSQSGGPGAFSTGDYDNEDDYDYSQEVEEEQRQQFQRSTHKGSSKQVISPNRVRTRRQANRREQELERQLNCGATQCTVIKCTAGPITSNKNVVFKLRARIWAQTISEVTLFLIKISQSINIPSF